MPAFYEITYLPEGRKERFAGSRGNYYVLEDGSQLDLHSEPVWCWRCVELSVGEKIRRLAEIDKELADLNDPSSQLYRFAMTSVSPVLEELVPRDQFRLDLIAEAQKRRQWREHRSSPPKCIHCGSTDILMFEMGKPVANPSGSGQIIISIIGMCSTGWNEWYFTSEGDRISNKT